MGNSGFDGGPYDVSSMFSKNLSVDFSKDSNSLKFAHSRNAVLTLVVPMSQSGEVLTVSDTASVQTLLAQYGGKLRTRKCRFLVWSLSVITVRTR